MDASRIRPYTWYREAYRTPRITVANHVTKSPCSLGRIFTKAGTVCPL